MTKRYGRSALVGFFLLAGTLPGFCQDVSEGSPTVLGAAAGNPDSAEKDYSAELPRLPPRSLADAWKAIEVAPGFSIQPIASEPLISDPVAFAFDARGRLFVVEMRDYSEQADEHLGQVALLTDANRDGIYDQRSTFATGLSWPTAIWPWRDGVLVAEPPRLTWYRDTDDDGVSDVAEDWFTGFSRGNVQGLVNSLRWGVDGWIHGATSSAGASLETLAAESQNVAGPKIDLGRRDFAIDPLNKLLRPESGGGQHGLSFNRWGDKFVTSNSDHLQQIVDLESWLANHATRVPFPSLRQSIAIEGAQAEVFRASPVEPWRVVRTRLRVSGVAPGLIEGGGRAAGYFTGATGTWIADAELGFGLPGYDTALVCDVGSNLIHRKQMVERGVFWSAQRIDENTELVRSSDVWFRPVQLGDGPDGAIYIADMAREVIEHPLSLPPMIKQHLDLTSGRELGRIWRLAPTPPSLTTAAPPHRPAIADWDLSRLNSHELIQKLGDPIPWQRLMSAQLLVERGAEHGTGTELEKFAGQSASTVGRMLAMRVAFRLGLGHRGWLQRELRSTEPRLVEHALHLAREHGELESLGDHLLELSDDPHPRIQLALALALADVEPNVANPLLVKMLPNVDEPLVRSAIANATGEQGWRLFRNAWLATEVDANATSMRAWLDLLLPIWSDQMVEDLELQQWVLGELSPASPAASFWLEALTELSQPQTARAIWDRQPPHQQQRVRDGIDSSLADGERDADQLSQPPDRDRNSPRRKPSLAQVVWLEPERQRAWLERTLLPGVEIDQQTTLIRGLAKSRSVVLHDYLIEQLRALTPRVQEEALRALASSPEGQQRLALALENGEVPTTLVPPDMRQRLATGSAAGLALRFNALFSQATADRAAVIADYRAALAAISSGEGEFDVAQETGEDVFRRACAQCHQVGSLGVQVGPPLQQLRGKSPEQLLEAILDPNREIDPKYISYGIILTDGRLLSGILRDETATHLTLDEAGGTTHSIARADIEQIKNSGSSLMPSGLEALVTPAQMNALLQFLSRSQDR